MKRVRIVVAILTIALVSGIGWQLVKPIDEPVYKGKRLSEWMLYDGPGWQTQPWFDEAVRHAGTNAIPVLLRMLRAKDSPLKITLMRLVQRQHIFKVQNTPAKFWNSTGQRGFAILGTDAQTAVPELIRIVNRNISPDSQICAMSALRFVGPSARAAIPSLQRWATNASMQVRSCAASVILRIELEDAYQSGFNRWAN